MYDTEYELYQLDKTGYQVHQFGVMNVLHERPLPLLSFKDVEAPIDVIVADLDKYEHLKTDPYLIYSEADKNGRMVYEKS